MHCPHQASDCWESSLLPMWGWWVAMSWCYWPAKSCPHSGNCSSLLTFSGIHSMLHQHFKLNATFLLHWCVRNSVRVQFRCYHFRSNTGHRPLVTNWTIGLQLNCCSVSSKLMTVHSALDVQDDKKISKVAADATRCVHLWVFSLCRHLVM